MGGTTELTLDEVGNTKVEKRTPSSGAATTITSNYEGSRLQTRKVGSELTRRHHYDSWGNLDCVTKDSVDPLTACKLHQGATSTNVYEDYTYDHLNRLRAYRAYNTATGARTDHARYFVDPLERVYRERENHEAWGSTYRVTDFFHSGLSDTVAKETLKKGTEQTVTKTYSFDAYGHRIALANDDPNKVADSGDFLYGYDVHGNVSQLSDVGTRSDSGATTVEGSYGYTPHGEKDTEVTKGDAGQLEAINFYRYGAKRLDTGNQGYFTGARQYGPQTGRFLQQDVYMGALSDLSLSLDPLTQNRYGLAGGNPISFVEGDGHMPLCEGPCPDNVQANPATGSSGGGGGSSSSGPAPSSTSPVAADNAIARNNRTKDVASIEDARAQLWAEEMSDLWGGAEAVPGYCAEPVPGGSGTQTISCSQASPAMPVAPSDELMKLMTGKTYDEYVGSGPSIDFQLPSVKEVWGAVERAGRTHLACRGKLACTASHYGTLSATACIGFCFGVSMSNMHGRNRMGVTLSGPGRPGGSVMFSPGSEVSSSHGYFGGGCLQILACGQMSVNNSRDLTGSVGVGNPGGFGGVFKTWSWDAGPSPGGR